MNQMPAMYGGLTHDPLGLCLATVCLRATACPCPVRWCPGLSAEKHTFGPQAEQSPVPWEHVSATPSTSGRAVRRSCSTMPRPMAGRFAQFFCTSKRCFLCCTQPWGMQQELETRAPCKRCPANHYRDRIVLRTGKTVSGCSPCPSGCSSNAGSTDKSACKCDPGLQATFQMGNTGPNVTSSCGGEDFDYPAPRAGHTMTSIGPSALVCGGFSPVIPFTVDIEIKCVGENGKVGTEKCGFRQNCVALGVSIDSMLLLSRKALCASKQTNAVVFR